MKNGTEAIACEGSVSDALVKIGGEQDQRRGLAGDPGDREQRAGDQAAGGGREGDPHRPSPARDPERVGASLSVPGTSVSTSCAVRATIGSITIASANAAGAAALLGPAGYDQPEDEDPGDDRRHSVEDVEHEANDRGDPLVGELGRVDRDQKADRDRHQRRRARPGSRCRRRVGDAAAGLAEERRSGWSGSARLSAPAPFRRTEPRTISSTATASTAATVETLLPGG